MPLISGLGWRKFLAFDTRIRCVTNALRAQAENNVEDCRDNPALLAELFRRCRAALDGAADGVNGGLGSLPGAKNQGRPVPPFVYEEEPTDEWRTFGLMAEFNPGQAIRLDCDCISPVWAAFGFLRWGGKVPMGVGISQPRTRPCRCKPSTCKGRTCTDDGPICDSCGYGMAHAYTTIRPAALPSGARRTLAPLLVPMTGRHEGISVLDGSVLSGMGRPRDTFYGSGETAVKWLRADDLREDEDSG